MSFLRKSLLIMCSLLIATAVLVPAGAVHAADQKWINQVWSDYKAFNKKTVDTYNKYQARIEQDYKRFNDKSQAALDELERKVLEDQEHWVQLLNDDYEALSARYADGSLNMRNQLMKYNRYINPGHMGSPMYNYARQANIGMLNSTMWKLDKELNDAFLNSYMWTYREAINPASLNSSAFKFKNTVNESYLNSAMYKLRNASSSSSLNSPMWKYKMGRISKTAAKNEYNKLFKKYTTEMSQSNAVRKKEIADMASSTQKKVEQLYIQTVLSLEEQREKTLQSISDLRKEITGEGLEWEPLFEEEEIKF
ncbi:MULTISPECIES: hypothetical protein [Paenibacillus]|uniref:Uncharacterized protein n=1 Tax=Paenibacillus campinasensis TaxID=66347 RepID=A0A268ETG4_9BACL|nr:MULTISPECIES: hypothetical protein [Paenibacillus]MUG67155.1 hypothetical protein [Paenibacillus campinasensis]PAD76419.1 hypothetical protein CHH67_12415 [Paenibacillus campinasensis]PAK54961.1 hypothetical protein CHH75_05400 [Paenibacillus sp. 7541]